MTLQFSLKWLFFGIGLLCVCFALIAWRFYLGLALSMVVFGVVILLVSIVMKGQSYPRTGILILLLGGLFFSFAWTLGPPVSMRLLNRIRTGMSQEQVRGLLGEPESVSEHGDWYYSPWGNQGWVTIYFDDSEAVAGINDESAW